MSGHTIRFHSHQQRLSFRKDVPMVRHGIAMDFVQYLYIRVHLSGAELAYVDFVGSFFSPFWDDRLLTGFPFQPADWIPCLVRHV